MSRIGKCKKCKQEFYKYSEYHDVYSYTFQEWFKLCQECYELETRKGKIKLCRIDGEGVITEIKDAVKVSL